jgi:hypothetical protein
MVAHPVAHIPHSYSQVIHSIKQATRFSIFKPGFDSR